MCGSQTTEQYYIVGEPRFYQTIDLMSSVQELTYKLFCLMKSNYGSPGYEVRVPYSKISRDMSPSCHVKLFNCFKKIKSVYSSDKKYQFLNFYPITYIFEWQRPQRLLSCITTNSFDCKRYLNIVDENDTFCFESGRYQMVFTQHFLRICNINAAKKIYPFQHVQDSLRFSPRHIAERQGVRRTYEKTI